MIKLTERIGWKTQDNAIAHWNNQKKPFASMQLVGEIVKQNNKEAIEELKVLKEKYDKAYDEFDKARDEFAKKFNYKIFR